MAAPKEIPVGLQLFSVHKACEGHDGKDLAAVLSAVAKMGYDGVEFAGYHGWDAGDLRKLLDDNGLLCCGTHVSIDTLLGDELERGVAFNKTIGNRFLIVPGLPPEYRDSLDAWSRTAGVFNEIAERLRPHGMLTGYHNHFHEFAATDGRSPWDVLIEGTSADVVMQLDVGNAMEGGGDCEAILRKYPGRAVTLHLKEFGGAPDAAVGEGEADWKELLPLAAEVGGTRWYIIEHERDPQRAMADVQRCLVNIRTIVADL